MEEELGQRGRGEVGSGTDKFNDDLRFTTVEHDLVGNTLGLRQKANIQTRGHRIEN